MKEKKKINSTSINNDNKKSDGPPKLWWPDKYVKHPHKYVKMTAEEIIKERKQRELLYNPRYAKLREKCENAKKEWDIFVKDKEVKLWRN